MRTKRARSWISAAFLAGACVALAGPSVAQVPGQAAPETPVSPSNPSAFPGTTAPGTSGATSPLNGAPCVGTGSTAINGATPGATPPPQNGVYGQNSANPGSC